MLQILHKGLQISLDLDTSGFTGVVSVDAVLSYITGLDAGMIAAYDSDGYAQLADGAAANDLFPIGFIINDAAGELWENRPALASGKLTVTFGNCVVITDQIDTALTFAPGEKVYCGTTGKLGLVTNVAPTGARVMGIAMNAATSASPNLQIAVLG